MITQFRGYNYIEDYLKAMHGDFSLPSKLRALRKISHINCEAFDNKEEEMRRFIAWLHYAHEQESYQELLDNDESGFLQECIALYDPAIGGKEPPKNPFDYKTNFN